MNGLKTLFALLMVILSSDLLTGCVTSKRPTDWVEVAQIGNPNNMPLFNVLAFEIIEKERLSIPTSAYQF